MNPAEPRSRLTHVDLVRIVGVLAVVAGHVWFERWAGVGLYAWHVPLFFVISGYLWRTGRRSVRQEITTRSASLLVPYGVWLVAIAPLFLAVDCRKNLASIPAALGRIVAGGSYLGLPFSAFWFVTALFAACVFYRMLDRVPFWVKGLLLGGLLAGGHFVGGLYAAVPLGIGIGLASAFFLWAGELLARHESRLHPALGPVILAVAIAGDVALGVVLDLKHGHFGVPVLSALIAILFSTGLLLTARLLQSRLSEQVAQIVSQLARVSLGVVLGHGVIIWLANAALDGAAKPLVFLLAVGLPWAASLFVNRSRFSRLILGAPTSR